MIQPIPWRIRVGVTGHRSGLDRPGLADRVGSVLTSLVRGPHGAGPIAELWPDDVSTSDARTPIRLTVVTPLAEGADRLLAKEALELEETRIEAVLPLAESDYKEDFATAESRQEFESLLGRAARIILLRDRPMDPEADGPDLDQARTRAYADVGQYVIEHCDVLVALWDGQPARGRGGTAEVVEAARARQKPLIIISTADDLEPSVEKGAGLDCAGWADLEAFNQVDVPGEDGLVAREYDALFDSPAGQELPGDVKAAIKARILPYFIRAEKAATAQQARARLAGQLVYGLAAASVAAVALGTIIHALAAVAFGLEAVLLLIILGSVFVAERQRTHHQWIENRLLGERLRSAVFFTLGGLEPTPLGRLPGSGMAGGAEPWTEKVVEEIWSGLPPRRPSKPGPELIEFVRGQWIMGQARYHQKKSKNLHRINRRLELGGAVIFGLALAGALAHLVVSLFHLEAGWSEQVMTFAAISLPALGAALAGIRAHREYRRLEDRSRHMAAALTELDQRFAAVDNPVAFEALMRECETLMLVETQDWLTLMKSIKLEAAG